MRAHAALTHPALGEPPKRTSRSTADAFIAERVVLLLTPSRGLGGGIERYVATVEWAFAEQRVDCHRIDLSQSGALGHARMLSEALRNLGGIVGPIRLVVAHRALLPVASILAQKSIISGITVVCHGSEVWGGKLRPRANFESLLMRRHAVRVVAVSSFTAGVLARERGCIVLPPGLSGDWFHELTRAAAAAVSARSGIRLLTAFRLADWEDKGLPQLIDAVVALARPDVSLTVCGSGEPPPGLLRLVGRHSWCDLRVGLSDHELASELASADLFVLATRTRAGRHPSGEGFGLVLLEAQVAGTPVVAPAYGGSRDSYLDGVTGLAPVNDSAGALADVLAQLVNDPACLAKMSARAAAWSRESFAPERYAWLAVEKLL